MEFLKIILLSIAAAVFYGILHDQVTVRVCVEYFTIGHPPIFHTESPTLLALGWGVVATWWVGLFLGIPAALVSQLGSWPKYDARQLLRPIVTLLVVMGCSSLLAGIAGYLAAKSRVVELLEPLASQIPESRRVLFIADLWAHLAAYGVGFFGGIVLCGLILVRRGQLATRVGTAR